MDQNLNKKINLRENIISSVKENKTKFFLLVGGIFIALIIYFLLQEHQLKKNTQLSEKYVTAGILLSKGKEQEAKKFYEEIIQSKNDFYSILAMNTILEKDLIKDKEKIKQYFLKLEKLNLDDQQNDLILFKKALYLIKTDDYSSGKKILDTLIIKDSILKKAAQNIIDK